MTDSGVSEDDTEQTEITIDAFEPVYREAKSAGIDPKSLDLEVIDVTNEADITIRIRPADAGTEQSGESS